MAMVQEYSYTEVLRDIHEVTDDDGKVVSRTVLAPAPGGWTKVVEGAWAIWDLKPHTKILVKNHMDEEGRLAAKNPCSIPLPTDGLGVSMTFTAGHYFKEVPFTEEEMTGLDKFMAEVYQGRSR